MALSLVAAQPGIWLADKLSPYQNAYVVAHYLELSGCLDVEALCGAITQAMMETDTLQMSYSDLDGDMSQSPGGALPLPAPEVWDLRQDQDPLQSCQALMTKDAAADLRLDSGNALTRHAIMRLGEHRWIWYQRYHHIQLDAFSFTALTRRMADLYSLRLRGSEAHRPVTQPFESFHAIVAEYEEYQHSPKAVKDGTFWKKYCEKLPEAASPSSLSLAGVDPSKHIIRNLISLDRDQFKRLCKAGSELAGLQSSDLALALITTWLLRLCGRTSMGAGFIFMRRLGSAALNAAGPFINVLPMLLSLETNDGKFANLIELSNTITKTLKLLRRHQKYDSEKIVRESGRNWDSNPLYGPVINFKAFDYRLDLEGLDCTTHHMASGPIRDIEIVLYVTDEFDVKVEYLANADRYTASTLNEDLERLPLLLDAFTSDLQNTACHQANFLLPRELEVIEAANHTEHPIEASATLASLLRSQATATPNRVALKDKDITLTYKEMQDQVDSLATVLRQKGVHSGDIVAVALPRSVFLSLALQAIVAAGATWLPLDRGYPKERLNMMLEDAAPKLLVLDQEWSNTSKTSTLLYDSLLPPGAPGAADLPLVSPENVAYVIYTSGSTGRPKGVKVGHRAIVNRLLWMQSQYSLDGSDSVLQKTPSSFDVSVWEFFWPLITGASLVMAPPESHKDPESLLQLIVQHNITTVHFVPSMLAAFLNGTNANEVTGVLRRAFCSGEALPTSLARHWEHTTRVPLYNLYGPTEAAIDVTAYPAYGDHLIKTTSVPIGSPVWNTQMHVLDEQMNTLPTGMAGDLYISGVQLADGYLNRPELTAERFIEVRGKRLYRTGDVAQWLPDRGVLEFLGRSDDQVKLRGQRLELGEIDSVMERLPGVSQAVTQPQLLLGSKGSIDGEDARQLVGYLVEESPGSVDLKEVHEHLYSLLPAYMVPVKLMLLNSLPISATGKLDRRALPLPAVGAPDMIVKQREPAPGLESTIAEAFKELLGCETVSADDDFFSLGGYSLLAVRLAAVLRSTLSLPVTIGQIMRTPRVSSLAEILADESGRDSWGDAGFENLLPLRTSPEGRTIFCVHPASGFSWQFSVLRRYLDSRWSLVGLQSAQADGVLASSSTLEDVVDEHLRTVLGHDSQGPYVLLGYSLGGTLAHALAARLTEMGRKVSFLGLLDTWPPETQNWDEKRQKNVVDEAVIEEMQRERQQFIAAQQGAFEGDGMSSRMFDIIESNYTSAVRLLATARSSRFEGVSTLFVAQRTFPPGTDLQEVWRPWTKRLDTVIVDCSHVDIISPKTFEVLGPQLNELLTRHAC